MAIVAHLLANNALSGRTAAQCGGSAIYRLDLTRADDTERERLAAWVRLYKQLRGLLHSGTVVRSDHPDPALWIHGVVATDLSRAVYALVTTATTVCSPPGRVRLPGLDPDAVYRVAPLPPGDQAQGPASQPLRWWSDGVELSGRTLAVTGLQAPVLFPERLVGRPAAHRRS